MARSLATETVKPRGSNDAWATQDAIIADLAVPCAAVTTYRPPLTRPSALATSGDIALFMSANVFFFVKSWPKSVPASSYN